MILNKDNKIRMNINGVEDEGTAETTEHDVVLQFKTTEKPRTKFKEVDNTIVISKGDFGQDDSIQKYFEEVFKPNKITIERDETGQLIITETAQEEDGEYEYKHIVTTRMNTRRKINKE